MKKIIIGMFILSLLTLTGCNFKRIERQKVDPNTNIETPIDLSINLPYVSETMSQNDAIPLLESLTGYKVTYNQFPAGSAAETELEGYFTSRKTDYHAVKLTKNQFNKKAILAAGLADLTDIVNDPKFSVLKNAISQKAWDAVTFEGKILGIPDSASNNNIDKSIIVRKDIMYNLINPDTNENYTEVPTTFDGFVKLLKAFKQQTGSTTAFTLPSNLELVPAIAASFGVEQLWQDIDGRLVYAAENPNLDAYIKAMKNLADEGLLDKSMQTNSFAVSADKFAKGTAIATVSNFWEMATINHNLQKEGGKRYENSVDFIPAFKNANGEMKTWQSGGVTYATVIPNWMADSGAFVIDYIQKKITEENFIKLVAGTQGVDYDYDEVKEEYYPLEGFSNRKRSADHFVTGTNDNVYHQYWTQVVIKGVPEFYFQWRQTNDVAFKNGMIGVLNPANTAPAFKHYSAAAAGIEDTFKAGIMRAILGDGSENAETIKNTFNSTENKEAIKEIKDWYSK